jgi:hypothetical protein
VQASASTTRQPTLAPAGYRLGEVGQGPLLCAVLLRRLLRFPARLAEALGIWSTSGTGWYRRVADIRAKATTIALAAMGNG